VDATPVAVLFPEAVLVGVPRFAVDATPVAVLFPEAVLVGVPRFAVDATPVALKLAEVEADALNAPADVDVSTLEPTVHVAAVVPVEEYT
jgi:hypothetical protein